MTHLFNTDIAMEYGLEEAILLENLYFWVQKNKANNKNCFEGKFWTYNSVKAFNDLFCYITPSKIVRALKKLEDEGLVESGCFNENKYDHTKWYTVTEKAKSFFENAKSNLQNEKSISQYDESIDTNCKISITDNKPNNKTQIVNTDEEETSNEVLHSPRKQKKSEPKHKYGQYQNVLLTDKEYESLKQRFGEEKANSIIQFFSEKKEMKGYKYKRDYIAINNWGIKAYEEQEQRSMPYQTQKAKENLEGKIFFKGE